MKIIEALKDLKTIQKRIASNKENIRKYSGHFTAEQYPFGDIDKQKDEVQSLIQANIDLTKRYLYLKQAIEHTNIVTIVTIGDTPHSISGLLQLKKFGQHFLVDTFASCDAVFALTKMRNQAGKANDATNPYKVELAYDEKTRNNEILRTQDFLSKIDAQLEIVNATTDLVEPLGIATKEKKKK